MDTVSSENLHQEGESILVDGIGAIGQHFNYWDIYWQSGTAYFIRDLYRTSLNANPDDPELQARYDRINSNILQWEHGAATRRTTERPEMGRHERGPTTTRPKPKPMADA